MKNVIILGGKPIDKDLKELIYSFDYVFRINMNTKWKHENESKKKDIYFCNGHVYDNFTVESKSLEQLKELYNYVNEKNIEDFFNVIKNKEYFRKIKHYEGRIDTENKKSNNILKFLKCPYRFKKQSRCGYQAILFCLYNEIKFNVTICGFSTTNKFEGTYYNKKLNHGSCHDIDSEVKILNWLIENKKINIIDEK